MKEIILSGVYGIGKVAIVDDEDFDRVSMVTWSVSPKGYVRAHRPGKNDGRIMLMHNFIMGTPYGHHTDHRDHDKLNNRKQNLRVCTPTQNHGNMVKRTGTSSKFKGVTWWKRDKRWKAQASSSGKHYNLGYFDSETDAAKAYDKKAKELFGEFAKLNFQ